MRCDWKSYVNLLPLWMREYVDKHSKEILLETRLRVGLPPELITMRGSVWMTRTVSKEDVNFCINTASRYSPWAASTISSGYVTASGGHRVGICGTAVIVNQQLTGVRDPTSVCIRVARDVIGIANPLVNISGSILIIGKPGSGKTTLLRDLIRQKSDKGPYSIAVIDEKNELFSGLCDGFQTGKRTDVISGCPKNLGIEIALRNMGPGIIAVDEITAEEDCRALLHAGWCGVDLFATAHAANRRDLYSRLIYRPIVESGLFDTMVVLQPDKSWRLERMTNEH